MIDASNPAESRYDNTRIFHYFCKYLVTAMPDDVLPGHTYRFVEYQTGAIVRFSVRSDSARTLRFFSARFPGDIGYRLSGPDACITINDAIIEHVEALELKLLRGTIKPEESRFYDLAKLYEFEDDEDITEDNYASLSQKVDRRVDVVLIGIVSFFMGLALTIIFAAWGK